MALAKLTIDLEARLANFQYNLDKASHLSEKAAAQIQAHWDSMSAVAEKFGVALGAAFSVEHIRQFILTNVDALDALNDVSDATGSSIEAISGLEAVALRTGDNLDLVSDVLIKFNAVLKEADGKNGVSQALEAIGLNAKDLRQLDPAEALRQTAVALSQYADDGNKARLIQELFGKSVKEAAHFLHDLADAGALNATATNEQAEAASRFNKQLSALQAQAALAARGLTADLIPGMSRLLDRFNESIEKGELLQDVLKGIVMLGNPFGSAGSWIDLATGNPDNPLTQLQEYQGKLKEVQEAVARVQQQGGPFAADFQAQSEKKIALYQKYISYYSKAVGLMNDAAGQTDSAELARRGRGATKSLPDYLGTATKKSSASKADRGDFVGPAIPESYTAALRALEQTDTAKIAELRAQLQYLANLKASGDNRLGIDEAILNLEQSLQSLDPALKRMQELNASVDELLNGPADQQAKINDQLSILQQRFAAGAISGDDFDRAAQTLYERLDQLTPAVKKTADDMATFWDQGMRNIQDSTSGFLVSAMKGDFASIESSFVAMVNRMVAESLAADLNKALFSSLTGASGLVTQGVSWVSSLFGGMSPSTAGTVASAIGGSDKIGTLIGLLGPLADGGPAQAGGIHPVVERGQPEMLNIGSDSYLLMPQRAGFVTPLQPARSSRADVRGGTINLTQHITTPPGTSRTSQDQMAARAYAGAVRAFSRKG